MVDLRNRLLYILLLLTLWCPAEGVLPTHAPFLVTHFTETDGIPNNTVTNVMQTSDGFLWLGTWYGLCRFDGRRFVAVSSTYSTVSDRPPRKIKTIVEDNDGNIWARTNDWKISVYFRDDERFEDVFDEIKPHSRNLQIIKLQKDDERGVLLLTKDKNLLRAWTTDDHRVMVEQLADSRGMLNQQTSKLYDDLVQLKGNRASWVERDHTLFSIVRNATQQKSNAMQRKSNATQRQGNATQQGQGDATQQISNATQRQGDAAQRQGNATQQGQGNTTQQQSNATQQQKLYAGMPKGNDLGQWRTFFQRLSKLRKMYTDTQGRTWRVENGTTLLCDDPRTGTSYSFPLTPRRYLTEQKFVDMGQLGLFFLSEGGDVLYINKEMEATLVSALPEMSDGKADTRYYDILKDSSGIVWLTTTDNGVYRFVFPPHTFHIIPLPGDGDDAVRSLFQHPDNGEIWVGTRSKMLYRLNADGTVKHVYTYAEHGIGSVYHTMRDSRGRIWMSTKGDGLVLATPDASADGGYAFTHYRHDARNAASLSGNNVYMTYEDSHHHIWVGTLDGGLNLMKEHDGRISFINKHNGWSHYPAFGLYLEVRNMVEDDNGTLWVGTIDGLMSLDVGFSNARQIEFKTYRLTEQNTLANGDIYALCRDRQKRIWVCTFGGGLGMLTGTDSKHGTPMFRQLGLDDGLTNDVVLSIIEDKGQRLWLVGKSTLACYDNATHHVQTFGRTEGFPRVEMEENAAMTHTNGTVWLGCKEGIVVFNPTQITTQSTSYPLYIVGATVNNQDIRSYTNPAIVKGSITLTKEIRLRYNQSMFTIEFAALNYYDDSQVAYRYCLKGHDPSWRYAGSTRMASYSRVSPGTYTFVVEALSSATGKTVSSRQLTIVISPPWWNTWWAYLLYAAVAAVVIWQVYRYARFQMKLKRDLYVKAQINEFKKDFYMQQKDAEFLKQMEETVERNINNADMDVDFIAKEMGMSRSAMFKRLKTLTGLSPSDYIRDHKLAASANLLKSTGMSISDIAYHCGFNDVGYFGKCFRKKYGLSAREFREKKMDL